jgi:hypothetical protein
MSTTDESVAGQSELRLLKDRMDISEVLYRYSSAIDSFDYEALRNTLADDIWAQYGNGEAVTSGDALAEWIAGATASVIWQHHLLNVYHVNLDGDRASTVAYLTSYQVFKENPDAAVILVARYHDELRREAQGWKISRRIMEVLWGETKPASDFLASLGGRGPKVWARD